MEVVTESEQEQGEAAASEDCEPDKAQSIRELLGQGYSPRQVKEQFGYPRTTVDRVVRDYIAPEAAPVGRDDDTLPMMKTARGVEVIPAEVILRRYMDGDGDQAELRGMMKLRAAMLLVSDLINMRKADAEAFALEVKPILELMKETREEQDAAAERSRVSSVEAAREAAHEVLGRAMPYLDDRLKSVEEAAKQRAESPSQHPFPQMMKMIDGTLAGVSGQMMRSLGFGGQETQEAPGFTYKRAKEGGQQ